jgi:hypothetical protein
VKLWKNVIVFGVLKVGTLLFLGPTLLFFLLDFYNYLLGNNEHLLNEYSWTCHIFKQFLVYFSMCLFGGGIVGLITFMKQESR